MTRRTIIMIVSVVAVLLTGIGYGGYKMYEQHQEKQRQQLKACQDVIVKDICSKYGGITKIEFHYAYYLEMGGVSYDIRLNNDKLVRMNYDIDVSNKSIMSNGHNPGEVPNAGKSSHPEIVFYVDAIGK